MSKIVENLDLRTRLENLYESLTDNNGTSKSIVEKFIGQLDLRSDYSILRDCCLEMKVYDWLTPVDAFIKDGVNYVTENEISFAVLNTLEAIRTNKDKKSFSSAINTLEELKDLSESELKKKLPNKMRTHSWVPGVKELISVSETVSGSNDSTDNRFDNSTPISPLVETESGDTLFAIAKRVYKMNESGEINIADNSEVSEEFASLYSLSENFTPTEDGLRLKSRNKIIDIKVNEDKEVSVELDGQRVNENHLSAALMSSGQFRTDEYPTIKVLEHAIAKIDSIFESDFVETSRSNVYEGVEVNLLKTDQGVYVNKINPHMNENTLVKPESTKEAIKLVQEFVDYDITNSVQDLLEAEATLAESKEKEESDVYERMDFIKDEISKLSELNMDEMEEIQEAKKVLNDALKHEQGRLNKMFKSKSVEIHEDSSDADYVPGELKIKVGTYGPGTKVQVSAGQYTSKGTKDSISVILPSNEVVDVQKKYLGVEI